MLYGGLDVSGSSNQVEVMASTAEDRVTNFASGGWEEVLGGLLSSDVSFGGFVETPDPDLTIWSLLGLPAAFTFTRTRPVAIGDVGYSSKPVQTKLTRGLVVGKAESFSLSAKASGALVRTLCIDTAVVTANGNSTPGVTVGAAAAGKTLYAFLHVLAKSGTAPTLDLVLQRDDDLGFPSALTAITFDQMSDVGWQVKTLAAGAGITDGIYRVNRTVGGTSPSFTYRLFVGIA
jgi:hypothetical protein